MTAPTVPTIDFGKMLREALHARQEGKELALVPVVQSVQDALVLSGVGVLLLLALASMVLGLSTRQLDRALLGLIAFIPLTMWAIHVLQTTQATFASAGLGFLLLAAAVATGTRGFLRLWRLVN